MNIYKDIIKALGYDRLNTILCVSLLRAAHHPAPCDIPFPNRSLSFRCWRSQSVTGSNEVSLTLSKQCSLFSLILSRRL